MADPFDLAPFIAAQAPVMDQVRGELRRGKKTSHWMWFVFPQLTALGTSAMAKRYGIGSVAQAQAYLADPTLGPRLIECCGLLLQAPGDNIGDILEYPDDLKFRSCLSLFLAAAPQEKVFQQCLDRFYAGVPDPRTVSLCRKVDNGQ